jgi:DNA-binding response OmpR family regulator
VLTFENVAVNIVTHQAFVDGHQLRVTPKEFSLLQQFMRRVGEAITRTELLDKVWDMHFDPGSNVVDVHVSRLRGKLHQAGATVQIDAVRGTGFILAARPAAASGGSDVVA